MLRPGNPSVALSVTRAPLHRPSVKLHAQSDEKSRAQNFLSFLCPILKAFSETDLKSGRARWLEVATSGLASLTRLPYGTNSNAELLVRADPPQPIRIYEFEACPFCRRVRESVTDLDLTVEIYPCPKDATFARKAVLEAGGKEQFPFLVDENRKVEMYESEAIVKYLYEHYGMESMPPSGLVESTPLTGWMPTVLRIGRGMTRYPKAKHMQANFKLLELFNYENNQFSRLVREVLCELELPYRCISCGKGSKNRDTLLKVQGSTQVPFLADPNTGTKVSDSEKIIDYLVQTYTID